MGNPREYRQILDRRTVAVEAAKMLAVGRRRKPGSISLL